MNRYFIIALFFILCSATSLFSQTKKHFVDFTPGMQNESLQQQALDAVNQKAENEKWKERYTKATILSTDWEIQQNEYTGSIICRKLYMVLYGVWSDGKCKAVEFSFRQDYAGAGTFSESLLYNSIGDMTDIECD